jgi:hypothetical protein
MTAWEAHARELLAAATPGPWRAEMEDIDKVCDYNIEQLTLSLARIATLEAALRQASNALGASEDRWTVKARIDAALGEGET